MKKYKRTTKMVITIAITLVFLLTSMSAYALNNLAVSVGKNYGDGVNTIKDAENADNAYKKEVIQLLK